MDRNQITGIVIISAIFIIYFVWFTPDQNKIAEPSKTEQTDSLTNSSAASTGDSSSMASNMETATGTTQSNESAVIPDSIQLLLNQQKYGIFSSAISDEKENINTLKTTNFTLTFSNKGGRLIEAELNNYKTWDQKPLIVFDKKSLNSSLNFTTKDGKAVALNDISFVADGITETADSATVRFTASLAGNKKIVRTYSISNKNYLVNQSVKFVGLQSDIDGNSMTLAVVDQVKRLEKAKKESKRRCVINYYTQEGDFDDMMITSAEEDKETAKNVKWIAFKRSFFTLGFIPGKDLSEVELKGVLNPDDDLIKSLSLTAKLPFNEVSSENGYNFSYYIGPNDYDILEHVATDFDRNVDFGWPVLKEVNKYAIYPIFKFLESFISSYGLIIIILVIIIKSALLPLTYRSQLGMAKMKVLKPEIDAINKKFEGDKQKAQVETMSLYKQFGVNPMSGCIPMILQMPVLFAMFRLFPNLLELRQKSFWWANDLSSYDDVITWTGGDFFPLNFLDGHISIFTLLMTLSTVAYTVFNNQMTAQTQPGMKTMSYLMPVVFFFVLNSYSSGLTFYYLLSNLFSIGQTIVIRRFVKEDKIREKLEANKIKNANSSKSSFQNSLTHALKKQQDKTKKK